MNNQLFRFEGLGLGKVDYIDVVNLFTVGVLKDSNNRYVTFTTHF